MALIICRFETVVVIDVEGKTVEECGKIAKRHLRDEEGNANFVSAELATESNLPGEWMDSMPYVERNDGPELICRKILAASRGEG